jgi:hypothetical protein
LPRRPLRRQQGTTHSTQSRNLKPVTSAAVFRALSHQSVSSIQQRAGERTGLEEEEQEQRDEREEEEEEDQEEEEEEEEESH